MIQLAGAARRNTRIKQMKGPDLANYLYLALLESEICPYLGTALGSDTLLWCSTELNDIRRAYLLDLFKGIIAQFVFEYPMILDVIAGRANGEIKNQDLWLDEYYGAVASWRVQASVLE